MTPHVGLNTSHDVYNNLLGSEMVADILLVCLYHPYWGKVPQHNITLDFIQSFLNDYSSSQICITGDINDLRFTIYEFFNSNNLQQLVPFHTRGRNTLDVFATSCPNYYTTPKKMAPFGKSDHASVLVTPSTSAVRSTWYCNRRDFSPANHFLFGTLMSYVCWSTLFSTDDDCNEMVHKFNLTVAKMMDISFPMKRIKIRSDDPPWMNPSIKILMNLKDRAYHRKHGYMQYIAYRDKLNSAIIIAKDKYVKTAFNQSSSSKQNWKVINDLIGKCGGKKKTTEMNYDDI